MSKSNILHAEMPSYSEDDLKKSIILKLNNFRTYADAEIKIPLNSVTLINGPSGSGKTTIFEAFMFILYNSVKGPEGFGTKKCWAWLFINNLIIYRQKEPQLLKVWKRSEGGMGGYHEYTQEEAQGILNQIFGSNEIFGGCSYLRQKEFSPFLTGTDAEKLALMKTVAMKGAELDEIKLPIKAAVNGYSDRFNVLRGQLEMAIVNIQRFDAANPTIIQHQIPQDPTEVLKRVQELRIQLSSMDQEFEAAVTRESTINLIRQQLDNAKGRKIALEGRVGKIDITRSKARLEEIDLKLKTLTGAAVDADKIAKAHIFKAWVEESRRLETKISEVERDLVLISQNLKKNLPDFPQFPSSNSGQKTSCSPEQITAAKDAFDLIDRLKAKLEAAKSTSAECTLLLGQIQCRNIDEAKVKLDAIEVELTKAKETEQRLKSDLDKARSANKMKCPSCSATLIIAEDGKHLEKCGDAPAPVVSGIGAMLGGGGTEKPEPKQGLLAVVTPPPVVQTVTHDDLAKAAAATASIISNRDRIAVIIRSVTEKQSVDSGVDINAAPSNLQLFSRFSDLKRSLDAFMESYQQHLNRRPEEVKENITDATDKNMLEAERASLIKTIDEHQAISRQIETEDLSIGQYASMMSDAASKTGPTSVDIRKNKANIQGQIDQLMHINNASELLAHRSILEKTMQEKAGEAQTAGRLLEAVTRLSAKATEAERQSLQAAVAEINTVLNSILKRLFTNTPISVEISTTKELKSKKNAVSQRFDIKIFFNNSEYGSAGQLSGGEKDRLSLAITLAMNLKFGSSILFLDETLSSLDTELKSEAVTLLKEYATNRTIVCVAHEETEGIYTHVIRVKQKSN